MKKKKTYFKLLRSAAVREALINVKPIVIPWIPKSKLGMIHQKPLKDRKAVPTVTITHIKRKLKVGPKLPHKAKQAHECSSKTVILYTWHTWNKSC